MTGDGYGDASGTSWVSHALRDFEEWLDGQGTQSRSPSTTPPESKVTSQEALILFERIEVPEDVDRRVPEDPVEFAERTLGLELGAKQREVLEAIRDHAKVVVPSCHAAGKTFLAAIVVLWWLFSRRPAYVITTAPTWRQVKRLLWKEIRALFRRLPEEVRGQAKCDMTQLQVLGEDGEPDPYHYAYGFSTEHADDMPGEHAENMLLVYDEAPGISDDQFSVMDTYQASRELMIGNPVNPDGRFRRAVERPELGWHTVRIAAQDTPNFTGEDLAPGVLRQLLQPSRVEEWKVEWGEESDYFKARVLAEFPDADADHVIAPLSWVQAAVEREPVELVRPTAQVGVDVARSGGNRTVIACRVGAEVVRIESIDGRTTTQEVVWRTAQAAEDLWAQCRVPVKVLIDETGVGAGVADLLLPRSDDRIDYRGVLFGGRATDAARFVNWRAEGYWCLRESLRAESTWPKLAVTWKGPETDRLRAQLAAIRYEFRGNRVKIESKDDMLARGMPSPDEADAVVMAVGPVPVAALVDNATVGVADIFDDFAGVAGGAARLPGGLRQRMLPG